MDKTLQACDVQHKTIPKKGLSSLEIDANLAVLNSLDMQGKKGNIFAYVYVPEKDVYEVQKRVYTQFLSKNALDFTVFPSLLELENQVCSMICTHLNAPPTAGGSFTSGGTESCFLAVKCAVFYWRKVKGIQNPEVVIATTAHACFHKACEYMSVKLIKVDCAADFRCDVPAMAAQVNSNTCLIVGSAGSYAHGVVDPIEELGKLALKHDMFFHVDGCIGGFILQYWKRMGKKVPSFDFTVPGVTSISLDLHKYAFCQKPASVVIYRNRDVRRYQFWASADWTGYTMINGTIQSTKTGGPVASAWATLNYIGDEGYKKIMEDILIGTNGIKKGIQEIPELQLQGDSDSNLVCFTSDTINVFYLCDEMKKRGWYIQPQLGYKDYSKENVHLSINPQARYTYEPMLRDLKGCIEVCKTKPSLGAKWDKPLEDVLSKYEGKHNIDERALYQDLMKLMGLKPDVLPDSLCDINYVLNKLPPRTKELLLKFFVCDVFTFDTEVSKRQEKELQPVIRKALKSFAFNKVTSLFTDNATTFLVGAAAGVAGLMLAQRNKWV